MIYFNASVFKEWIVVVSDTSQPTAIKCDSSRVVYSIDPAPKSGAVSLEAKRSTFGILPKPVRVLDNTLVILNADKYKQMKIYHSLPCLLEFLSVKCITFECIPIIGVMFF